MSAQSVSSVLGCDDVRASLSAFALGILDPDESAAIEEHLSSCANCRDALAHELETVGALALAIRPATPSAEARGALLAAIETVAAPSLPAPISLESARKASRVRSWLLPAVSIAAALLLIGVGVLGVLLNRTLDDRDDARSVAQLLSTYVSSGGEVVTMQAQDSSIYTYYKGQGSLLTAPGKDPVVVVAGCPESGDKLTYWVWFEQDGERTRAGKLTVGDNGSGWLTLYPEQPLTEFDSIGITVQLEDDQREDVLVAPLSG
jgi:hypothetical protein